MSDLADGAASERSAYVHIPFCHRRCPYCDFAVIDMEVDASPIDRYLAAIEAEIAMSEDWRPLHAVNLGGGTPSVLSAEQIGAVLTALEHRLGILEDAEVSIEANPEDMTGPYAEQLRSVGVNRVSLGTQSFDASVLGALGRAHTPDDGVVAVTNARAAGMKTVNIDLIFGTPCESIDSWIATVRTALALGTEHLSAYALTVELGTELSRLVADGAPGPDDDDQADKYDELARRADLFHYEVSNWARPGHECRYNLTTWTHGEYLGFGIGAHAHRAGVRTRNYRRLDQYLHRVESRALPIQGTEQLGEWKREKERVFLGLRLRTGVLAGVAGAELVSSAIGRRFVDAGVIATEGDRLVVLRPLLTDAVAREVLGLEPPSGW